MTFQELADTPTDRIRPLRSLYRIVINSRLIRNRIKQKPREKLHQYWRNPSHGNLPEGYLQGKERSEFLVSIIKKYEKNLDAKILDIGCNVGRNLNYLFFAGYQNNLCGIEINSKAIQLMKTTFPEMFSKSVIYNQSVENKIKDFKDLEFDIVFTMAVLEHIHDDSKWVFQEIARITKKYLICIEDEYGVSWRHFPRNYKEIFEVLGMKQVEEIDCQNVAGINDGNFYARVFKKL